MVLGRGMETSRLYACPGHVHICVCAGVRGVSAGGG